MLAGCATGQQYASNAYTPSQLNTKQKATPIKIIALLSAKVQVENKQGKDAAMLAGGIIGALAGGLIGNATGGTNTTVGAVAGAGVGAAAGALVPWCPGAGFCNCRRRNHYLLGKSRHLQLHSGGQNVRV